MLPIRKKKTEQLKRYKDTPKEQKGTVVIEKAKIPEKNRETINLTHHGVVHDDKAMTKLRIVFYASPKPSQQEPGLHESLYKGPNLKPLLYKLQLNLDNCGTFGKWNHFSRSTEFALTNLY